MSKKYWSVEFPTYRYKEDVKKIAATKKLTVIDSRYAASKDADLMVKNPPTLTLKAEYQPEIKESPQLDFDEQAPE